MMTQEISDIDSVFCLLLLFVWPVPAQLTPLISYNIPKEACDNTSSASRSIILILVDITTRSRTV